MQKLPEETCTKEIEAEKSGQETSKVVEKLTNGKPGQSASDVVPVNGEVVQKIRKKYKKRRLDEDIADDPMARPKKKALTVKLMLEEKRIVESKKILLLFFSVLSFSSNCLLYNTFSPN